MVLRHSVHGGDRVGDVPLGPKRRRCGVGNRREWQVSRTSGSNEVLRRGESSPFRRPGIRRPRYRACRDGRTLASRALVVAKQRPPASGTRPPPRTSRSYAVMRRACVPPPSAPTGSASSLPQLIGPPASGTPPPPRRSHSLRPVCGPRVERGMSWGLVSMGHKLPPTFSTATEELASIPDATTPIADLRHAVAAIDDRPRHSGGGCTLNKQMPRPATIASPRGHQEPPSKPPLKMFRRDDRACRF